MYLDSFPGHYLWIRRSKFQHLFRNVLGFEFRSFCINWPVRIRVYSAWADSVDFFSFQLRGNWFGYPFTPNFEVKYTGSCGIPWNPASEEIWLFFHSCYFWHEELHILCRGRCLLSLCPWSLIVLFKSGSLQPFFICYSCVVDKNVKAAIFLYNLWDQILYVLFITHVSRDSKGINAHLL